MKSILLLATALITNFAQADIARPVFTCSDVSFSYDQIEVSDVGDKYVIYINSGYNQSLSLNPFLGKQAMSGRGSISVLKSECQLISDNPNLMRCQDANLDIKVTLENRPGAIDPIQIVEQPKGTIVLQQVNKLQLLENGKIGKSRSAELSVVTNDENFERRSIGAEVSCARQAFEELSGPNF